MDTKIEKHIGVDGIYNLISELNRKNEGPVQGYEVVNDFDAITPDMPDMVSCKKRDLRCSII